MNEPEAKAGTVRIQGEEIAGKVKQLFHEGNVRRIVVKNRDGDQVLDVPVTAGVIAAFAAPVVTTVGAIAALAGQWSIDLVRRGEQDPKPAEEPQAAEEPPAAEPQTSEDSPAEEQAKDEGEKPAGA